MTENYLTRKTLLSRLKQLDNESSWHEFHNYYSNFIHSIILKMGILNTDVDDLSQKVLLKIWQALPTFDYNKSKGHFRNWLYTVTKNTVLSYIDKERKKQAQLCEDYSLVTTSTPAEIDTIINEEWELYISERAFNTIKEKVSERSLECFKAGLRGEDVATAAKNLNIEENTVYIYKNRVKQKLLAEISNLRDLLE